MSDNRLETLRGQWAHICMTNADLANEVWRDAELPADLNEEVYLCDLLDAYFERAAQPAGRHVTDMVLETAQMINGGEA